MLAQTIKDYAYVAKYFFKRYPRRTAVFIVFSVILAFLELISAGMILPVLSLGMNAASENRLLVIVQNAFSLTGLPLTFAAVLVVFVVFYLLKIIASLLVSIYVEYTKLTIEQDFRRKLIEALQGVSWPYITGMRHGVVVNLMTFEIGSAAAAFAALQAVAVSLLMLAVYACLGLTVSPELIIVSAIMILVALPIARPLFAMARRAGGTQVTEMRQLAGDLHSGLLALKPFKAMGREKKLLAGLATTNRKYTAAQKLGVRSQQFLIAAQQVILVLGLGVGGFVGHTVLGMGFDEIGFLAILLYRTNTQVSGLLNKLQAVAGKVEKLEKFEQLSDEIAAHKEQEHGRIEPNYPEPITFDDVTFRHGERLILDGASLVIPPKGMTTIIGASGAGKTTVLDLICGFQTPLSGGIRIGEHDLQTLDMRRWRRMIGYVTQDANVMGGTIRANVAAFDEDVTEADIVAALKMAGAWTFVASLPDGLDANIGEAGARISGGERQRISIARALARRPKILILDEPTAAVDSKNEGEIIKTLDALKREIPILAISHQPALAQAADVVYSLADGKLRLWRHGDQTPAKAAGAGL